MTFHQKIFALITSITILALIFELVRRKKLKEEYSWLWILVGVVMVVLVLWYDLLVSITSLIGAVDSLTTLFLFGFIFLILINVHYSVKISLFTDQIKKLSQHIGLLNKKVEELEEEKDVNYKN